MAEAKKNAAEKALEKLQAGDEKPALTPEVQPPDDNTSLIVREFGTAEIALGNFVSRIGLELPDDLTFKDWQMLAGGINTFSGAMMWILGDWLNYGEDKFKQEFSQFISTLDYAEMTKQEALRIAQRYPKAARHEKLSWTHHQTVAGLPAAEREALLAEAQEKSWSRDQLRDEMRVREGKEKGERKTRTARPKRVKSKGMTLVQVVAFIENEFEPELKEGMKAASAFFKGVDKIKDEIQESKEGITQKQAGAFADLCQSTGAEIGKLESIARRIAAFEIREEEPAKPKEKKEKKPRAKKSRAERKEAKAKIDAANKKAVDELAATARPENAPDEAGRTVAATPAPVKKATRKKAAAAPAAAEGTQPAA